MRKPMPLNWKEIRLPKRLLIGLAALGLALAVARPPFRHARTAAASSLAVGVFLRRRLRLTQPDLEDGTLAVVRERTGESLLVERTLEAAEAELREKEAALRQLQETYRNVARLHREQKTQISGLQAGQQIMEIAATTAPNADGCAVLLNFVMDALEAGGGVFWKPMPGTDALEVAAAEGRVLPAAHFAPLEGIAERSAAEIRAACENQLAAAAPAVPPQLRLPLSDDIQTPPDARIKPLHPILIALIRAEAQDENPGAILGAIGLCEPRGLARYNAQDTERLQSLTPALASALQMLEARRADRRSLSEITALYDLSRLIESASDIAQVYKAVVAQVAKIVPCENVALFLLDKPNRRLELRAARGRAVNLLEHFAFERGKGVVGWVASRGKEIVISDMDKAPNVLNPDSLPSRVRSFAAIPMRVQNSVIGALHLSDSEPNAFSPDDVRLLSLIAGQAAVTIERAAEHHNLETLAITDGLTRTYNHRYFQMRLDDELRRCKRYHLPLSLLMIDADHFKAINDAYGHASGDAVLRDMGAVLRDAVRDTEIVARLGGEEFGVLLPQTDAIQAQSAAERLRARVEAHDFRSVDGQPIHVTISLGIAGFPPDATRADLMEQADRALYSAKHSGRNCIGSMETPVLALAAA